MPFQVWLCEDDHPCAPESANNTAFCFVFDEVPRLSQHLLCCRSLTAANDPSADKQRLHPVGRRRGSRGVAPPASTASASVRLGVSAGEKASSFRVLRERVRFVERAPSRRLGQRPARASKKFTVLQLEDDRRGAGRTRCQGRRRLHARREKCACGMAPKQHSGDIHCVLGHTLGKAGSSLPATHSQLSNWTSIRPQLAPRAPRVHCRWLLWKRPGVLQGWSPDEWRKYQRCVHCARWR